MNTVLGGILDVLPAILMIVFVLIIIAGGVSKSKTKKHKRSMLRQRATVNNTVTRQKENVINRSYRMLEDRENDWLARQRREEEANKRRFSAMYGLKRMHESNCPARSLRDRHHEYCDADGVDTGTAR